MIKPSRDSGGVSRFGSFRAGGFTMGRVLVVILGRDGAGDLTMGRFVDGR